MFITIKRLYEKTGDVSVAAGALRKGWITRAQYAAITGEAV